MTSRFTILLLLVFSNCVHSTKKDQPHSIEETLENKSSDSDVNPVSTDTTSQVILLQKFNTADTVLLVSHLTTTGEGQIYDKKGKPIPFLNILNNQRPNFKIFKEQKILTKQQLEKLTQILFRPSQEGMVKSSRCYVPHHSIFLLKNGQTSYIDICFHCLDLEKSDDLKNLEFFDDSKWSDLLKFFKRLHFKYEMP